MEISEQEYNELKACERICNGISYTVILTQEQLDKLNILSNPDGDFSRLQDACIQKDTAIAKYNIEKQVLEKKYEDIARKVYAFNYSFIGRLVPIKI